MRKKVYSFLLTLTFLIPQFSLAHESERFMIIVWDSGTTMMVTTTHDEYHNFRPHQSLGYLTPNEYYRKTIGKTIKRVLPM